MKTYIMNPMRSRNNYSNSLSDKSSSVGGNTGNLIFYEAAKEQINYADEITVRSNISAFNNGDANIAIPSSNFLMHGGNDSFYQNFIDFLNRTTCPVTLVGLGAQSSPVFNTPRKLVGGGIRSNKVKMTFFKMLSERTATIGVRDLFTAECLELMGISNYRIIGCPSYFKWTNGIFPSFKEPDVSSVQMSVTPSDRPPFKTGVLDMGIEHDCFWMMQSISEIPQMKIIFGKEIVNPKWRVRQFPFERHPSSRIKEYANSKAVLCFSYDQWNEFYDSHNITFAFGTRFHGNMAAFRHRIPALWITHDSRTRGLTDLLCLPHIDLKSFASVKHLEELVDRCNLAETERQYPNLCRNYVSFLDENGISHKFHVR